MQVNIPLDYNNLLNVNQEYDKNASNLVNVSEIEILRTEEVTDGSNTNSVSLLNIALSEGINLENSNNTLPNFDIGAGTLLESMVLLS